jgi:glycosidase
VIYLVMTDRFADGNPANNQPGYDRAAPQCT